MRFAVQRFLPTGTIIVSETDSEATAFELAAKFQETMGIPHGVLDRGSGFGAPPREFTTMPVPNSGVVGGLVPAVPGSNPGDFDQAGLELEGGGGLVVDVPGFGSGNTFAGGGMEMTTLALGGFRLLLPILRQILTGAGLAGLAEQILPGDAIPLVPSLTEFGSALVPGPTEIDMDPPVFEVGGLSFPWDRKGRMSRQVLAVLSQRSGIMLTSARLDESGGLMGSYLPSPEGRKRGYYLYPNGAVKTWAYKRHIVVSANPRARQAASAAKSLDRNLSKFVQAERTAGKAAKKAKCIRRRK